MYPLQAYTSTLLVANTTIPAVDSSIVYIDVQITEPLLMSPFIFGSPKSKQGFYGITKLSLQMSLAANTNRAWSSVKLKTTGGASSLIKNAHVQECASSQLIFTSITGHPSDQLPSRAIVPYYELPMYRSAFPKNVRYLLIMVVPF